MRFRCPFLPAPAMFHYLHKPKALLASHRARQMAGHGLTLEVAGCHGVERARTACPVPPQCRAYPRARVRSEAHHHHHRHNPPSPACMRTSSGRPAGPAAVAPLAGPPFAPLYAECRPLSPYRKACMGFLIVVRLTWHCPYPAPKRPVINLRLGPCAAGTQSYLTVERIDDLW
jgi:hypothetical protein